MMGLPGMYQDHVVPQGQQELVEILPVTAGRLQANPDLSGGAVELGEDGGQAGKARRRIRDGEGRTHGGFVRTQNTDETGLTAHIDADDVVDRGAGASGGGRIRAWHCAPPLMVKGGQRAGASVPPTPE